MEMDALRKKAKVTRARETEQNRWTEDELLRVRTCWSHGQRLLVQGNEPGQYRTQQQGQERQKRRKEQCERSQDSDEVSDDSTTKNPSQSNLENHTRTPPLGTVPSPWMRLTNRVTKLDTSWQRSGTENRSASPKTCMLCTDWWTIARMNTCALHETLSGSPSNQAGIPIWFGRVDTN